MEHFILAFMIFLVLLTAMAIGVIMGRKPIAGSCGGMTALGMDTACDICYGNPMVCETERQKTVKAAAMAAPVHPLYKPNH